MVTPRRPSRKHPAYLKHADHGRLWALVEGAVADAFNAHPDYLTDRGRALAIASVTKRVCGQLVGYARSTREGSRPGDCPAPVLFPSGAGPEAFSAPKDQTAARLGPARPLHPEVRP